MGIIAVLAGLTVVAMGLITRRGPEFNTSARIQKVKAVVDQWRQRFDQYPPSDLARIRRIAGGPDKVPAMPDSFNVGIESLYQALYWPTFGGDPQLGDGELGNTDDDEFDKPGPQGKTPYEIIDDWGNPLIYFVNTDYARADGNGEFQLRVPDAGKYYLLVVSRNSQRPAQRPIVTQDLAQIGRYFLPATELLGQQNYQWSGETIRRDRTLNVLFE